MRKIDLHLFLLLLLLLLWQQSWEIVGFWVYIEVCLLFHFVAIEGRFSETTTDSGVVNTRFCRESVDRFMTYASKPLSEFNSYGALEMIEAIQRCAHDNTAKKSPYSTFSYCSLLLRLLGDKNYDKVCEAVSQVEKSYARDARKEQPVATRNFMRTARSSPRSFRCFYCQQPGHFKANCYKRKRDMKLDNPSKE